MWQLAGTAAQWSTPALSARLDLLRPQAGLFDVRIGERALASASVLQVETQHAAGEETLLDAYVRGCDLIATYAQTSARQVRPQIYWRALPETPGAVLGGVELIVSTQTSLLDVDTSLATQSLLPLGEVLELRTSGAVELEVLAPVSESKTRTSGPGLFLFRPAQTTWSYAEMVYPTDFASATLHIAPSNSVCLVNSLFPERLEKGVIRRGRIRGLFLPRAADEMAALAAYSDFVASPLPLTT